LRFAIEPQDAELLDSYLCPDLQDGDEQGWEETVFPAMTYLLKTSLAKVVKETTTLPPVCCSPVLTVTQLPLLHYAD
jgi:hypothetical protein